MTFSEQAHAQPAPGSNDIRLQAVRIRDREGQITPSLDIRQPFTMEIQYRILRRTSNLRVGLTLTAGDGVVVLSSTDMDNTEDGLEREPGIYVSHCTIPGDFLNYGQYCVSVGADFPMMQAHFFLDRALAFRIEQTGGVGGSISDGRSGILRLRLPWDIEKLG